MPEMKWLSRNGKLNPTMFLHTAAANVDVLQGLIPFEGITWLYGPSMSFKSFIAMSIASAVANGDDWMGRRTRHSSVIYIGAEGGGMLHVRRAAAEYHAGRAAEFMLIAQERPQLDTPQGSDFLRGILDGMFPTSEDDESNFGYDAQGNRFRYAPEERSQAFNTARGRYSLERLRLDTFTTGEEAHVLVVLDTYSQTAGGDDKTNVTAYVKALREAGEVGNVKVSFLVIDHATKSGGSYMGSVAKLNDVDSQLEVIRDASSMRVAIYQRKCKDGRESAPVHLEMMPYEFADYPDIYGDNLSTLVVRDGIRAVSIAGIADGKAGVLLTLIMDAGAPISEADLRDAFYAHPSNAGSKPTAAIKAFKRAKDKLLETNAIDVASDGCMSVSVL